jgi:hypothetical protein
MSEDLAARANRIALVRRGAKMRKPAKAAGCSGFGKTD